MERIARRLSKSESRRERGKVARLLRLRDADEYLNSIRASPQNGDHKGTPAHRLEWDTYLPCHPAYILLLAANCDGLEGRGPLYGEFISSLRLYTDSLHDSGIHPPIARPLALRSTFNRAPPSFGDSGGSFFDSVPERERIFGRSGAAPWLE